MGFSDLLPLTDAELDAAVRLSDEAGWNQSRADWQLMLMEGCALAARDAKSAVIGTALAMPVGPALTWISMVLVDRRHRNRGLGTQLLLGALDQARRDGAAVGLDATELGRPLYLRLGFRDGFTITRYLRPATNSPLPFPPPLAGEAGAKRRVGARRSGPPLPPRQAAVSLPAPAGRDFLAGDIAVLAAIEAAMGAHRPAVLGHLLGRWPAAAWQSEQGFVLARDGRTAFQVGPLWADRPATAAALLDYAVAACPGPVIVDAPDGQGEFAGRLAELGFVRQRAYMRMVYGDAGLSEPPSLFAIAGPEFA